MERTKINNYNILPGPKRFIYILKQKQVLENLIAWIKNWIINKYTIIVFPGYKSQIFKIDAEIL